MYNNILNSLNNFMLIENNLNVDFYNDKFKNQPINREYINHKSMNSQHINHEYVNHNYLLSQMHFLQTFYVLQG